MNHTSLIEMLENYNPYEHKETIFKQQMISFANNYKNCFERSLTIGHFTASAWVINKYNTHALLMHHTKLDKWFQLGGHCDGNTNILAVAIKEVQEESGIQGIKPVHKTIFDIDVHLIPTNNKEAEHYHYDIRFLLQVASNEELVQNRESKELRWIGKNISKLPTDNPSVIRMFNKWISI